LRNGTLARRVESILGSKRIPYPFEKFNTRHRELRSNISLCRLLSYDKRLEQKENPLHEIHEPRLRNQILAALSDEVYQRLSPHPETVDLIHSKILYEIGGAIDYVYFPVYAVISLVTEMSDGKIVEVGIVGNEGMSGIAALMNDETSPERAIVQIPDHASRVKLSIIKAEFQRGGELQALNSL
jgi:hypothetical protein